jgi:signal peptidase I
VTFGLLCAVAAGLAAGFFLVTGAARDPAASMAPGIPSGSMVMFQRGASGIVHGDVVLIRAPGGSALVVKRVIGLPGDRVACCDPQGRVTVNGKFLSEDYLPPGAAPSQARFTRTIGPGQVWVMGDNRLVSADSREWGQQPMSAIAGRVLMVSRPGGWSRLRTPPGYITAGLAPADARVPVPFIMAGFTALAILALIVQATIAVIAWAVRRRRERRMPPRQAW